MFFCDVGQVAPRLDSSASDGANGWDAARHRKEIVVINRTSVQVAKVIALLFASVGAHLGHAQGQNTLPFADPQIKWHMAYVSLAPDEALVVDFVPPACDYWMAEMAGTGERSYKVINARDGTFGVEISPPEQGAPLVIFGFISEAEALAWIDGEQSRATNPDAISENWLAPAVWALARGFALLKLLMNSLH